MSMNLCFETTAGSHVDFPYQTSTKLTYAVINERRREERLELIREDLESMEWVEREVNDMLLRVEEKLTDPELTLGVI